MKFLRTLAVLTAALISLAPAHGQYANRIANSTAPSHQWANGVNNGSLVYARPDILDLTGLPSTCATALTWTGSAFGCSAGAGTGTVTNVATGDGLTGGPITGTGTLNAVSVLPQGRLTLATATPYMTSTVSGATTVYYTPYVGNLIPLWNGSKFVATAFSEVSQATTDTTKSPAAAGASQCYDELGWLDGATFRVTRSQPWSAGGGSNTARGTGSGSAELQRTNGILVNKWAVTNGPAAGYGTYLGSICTNASSQVDWILGGTSAGGTQAVLYVWNMYNRLDVILSILDSTATYAYTSTTIRAADNSNNMRVWVVSGLAEGVFQAEYLSLISTTGVTTGGAAIGVGQDSTTTMLWGSQATVGNPNTVTLVAPVRTIAPLGAHYFQALEKGQSGYSFGGAGYNNLYFNARM